MNYQNYNIHSKTFSHLLKREVSRKEFLVYIAVVLLTVTGISRMIAAVKNPELMNIKKSSQGFGGGPYGK